MLTMKQKKKSVSHCKKKKNSKEAGTENYKGVLNFFP